MIIFNSTRGLVETQVLAWHSTYRIYNLNPNVEFIDIKISNFIRYSYKIGTVNLRLIIAIVTIVSQ